MPTTKRPSWRLLRTCVSVHGVPEGISCSSAISACTQRFSAVLRYSWSQVQKSERRTSEKR
eukprot:6483246-Amphidinium_carterae.2